MESSELLAVISVFFAGLSIGISVTQLVYILLFRYEELHDGNKCRDTCKGSGEDSQNGI